VFTPWRTLESLINLCQPGLLPDFSGTIRYETTFAMHNDSSEDGSNEATHQTKGHAGLDLVSSRRLRPSTSEGPTKDVTHLHTICPDKDSGSSGQVFLDLGAVGEVAQVWMNGTALGTRICRPYSFDATPAIRPGENTLRIEVTNTLVYALKDDFSRYINQEPSGLIGPVRLRYRD
jgi:hypothetical protein